MLCQTSKSEVVAYKGMYAASVNVEDGENVSAWQQKHNELGVLAPTDFICCR